MKQSNVMVIDDSLLVAEGLKELLKTNLKPRWVIHFNSADHAKKELAKNEYNHLFIGTTKNETIESGFIEDVRTQFPSLAIVLVCAAGNANDVAKFFALGINGILSKCDGLNEIKLAIKTIKEGSQYVSTHMALLPEGKAAKKNGIKLSKRESEVIHHAAHGKSILETAHLLQLSHHTIIAHRRKIMDKLGVKSAPEMVGYVYKNGLC